MLMINQVSNIVLYLHSIKYTMSTYTLENGNTVTVKQDTDPQSPREWDNLAKIICFHSRYNIGEKHDYKHGDYSSFSEMGEDIIRKENAAVIMPIYMYDHSGICISTKPFSCPWDSGQIGWAVVSKEMARKEYSCKRVTKAIIAKITSVVEGEIETYSQYLEGDVYGYEETNSEGKDVGSCWGFFGNDPLKNGMEEHFSSKIKK